MSSGEAASGAVRSLARALDLLEVLRRGGGHLSISELAEESGLPLPTIHRLLATLIDHGFVRRLPDRRYALGFTLVQLGSAALSVIGPHAGGVLRELASELGETANLAVLSGSRAEYVAQAPSPHAMRMFTEVGRRVELYCTGVGKALLTQQSNRELDAYIAGVDLAPQTEHTLVTAASLRDSVVEGRRAGYVLDEQEQEIGVRCVAVPVPSPVPMAVSISGPVTRMSDVLIAKAIPLLTTAADRLAEGAAGNRHGGRSRS